MAGKMTITEKILARHAGRDVVSPGENIWVDADVLMTHDVFGPAIIRIFEDKFGEDAEVWDKEKVVIIPDHYIFTEDAFANRNVDFVTAFVKKHSLPNYYQPGTEQYSGVCHITLSQEGFNVPGGLLLGTDSHTCTSGAFGMFSTGIGNTEGAYVLRHGRLWLRVPETIKVVFNGKMPDHLMAKDLILALIGDIGVDGATYRALEFSGFAVESMSMEERMTLCNMAVEAGAKNGIIQADQKTLDYSAGKFRFAPEIVTSDEGAEYLKVLEYDVETMPSIVAKPHSPDNKAEITELRNTRIDRAYVGSCTGGKIEDFIAAARILKGRHVAVDTFIVPATQLVARKLDELTIDGQSLRSIFEDGGCLIGPASCAACLGGPADTFGRANNAETVISSTNRNFPGRMGSRQSSVYLASPMAVMASALTGTITDPRDYL